MDFVTVYSDFNAAEAHLVRSRLEAARFHPFITNEGAADWMGGGSCPAFSVRVQVPEAEAADAREFLAAPADSETPQTI
jgi:hypothetical protein